MENLTQSMQDILSQSGVTNGTLTLFVKHTTASVMIIEDEPGIRADTQNFLECYHSGQNRLGTQHQKPGRRQWAFPFTRAVARTIAHHSHCPRNSHSWHLATDRADRF